MRLSEPSPEKVRLIRTAYEKRLDPTISQNPVSWQEFTAVMSLVVDSMKKENLRLCALFVELNKEVLSLKRKVKQNV